MHLTVKQPFGDYAVGDQITDLNMIATILSSELAAYVIPVGDDFMVSIATGQFTGIGPSTGLIATGNINVSIWPVDTDTAVVGTFQVERSFDGGGTWLPVTALDSLLTLTLPSSTGATAISTIYAEPESGVLYRIRCTAYSGGAANYRLSVS